MVISKGVTIDARWLVGGIGTYTRHLLEGLSRHGNGLEVHAITRKQHEEVVKQWCSNVTVVNIPIYTIREQWAMPWAARGCDLLHIPHYNGPLLSRSPMVASILDLIQIMDAGYRDSIKSWMYARPMLNLIARKAEHVITISNYSKCQIIDRLGVPESKISVIYCGVDGDFRPMERETALTVAHKELGIRDRYVLYVGSLKPYKNVSSLLKGFAALRKRCDIQHTLIILGNDTKERKRALLEESIQLGIENRTKFVPYVAQDVLPMIYAAADLLVMPSRIEGFGLPVLEGMACGTPVLCSRAASMPEVGGDAVYYFDPEDIEGLADGIEQILSSSELQANLRMKGLTQAKRFTWEESARKHLELYLGLLGRGS